MKDCPQCKGSGLTRLDWVKVPVWQACACTPSAALAVPISWSLEKKEHTKMVALK